MSKIFLQIFLVVLSVTTKSQQVKAQSRILRGDAVDIRAIPYQVSIRLREKDTPFGAGHLCGGSLISQKTVLTAAHCLYGGFILLIQRLLKPNELYVVMGSAERMTRTPDTLIFDLDEFYHHPKYNRATIRFDVGLLYLKGQVPVDHPFIRPIQLISVAVPAGTPCRASGWGRISKDGPLAKTLLAVDVSLVDFDRCDNAYKPIWGAELRRGMICAGGGDKATCNGDSGGPLVCNGKVAGIVSWGVKCGERGHPGVYTDVNHFRSWILANGATSFKLGILYEMLVIFNVLYLILLNSKFINVI